MLRMRCDGKHFQRAWWLVNMFRNAITRLTRTYPSLNLKVKVSKDKHEVGLVLPGLRFDDIDHTGQPNIYRVFDMLVRVENAACYSEFPFLDFDRLHKQDIHTIVKACTVEVKSDFYEITTPKAPLGIQIKLDHIGNTTFTTVTEMCCGGKLKPSVRLKSLHNMVHIDNDMQQKVPDWWRAKFEPFLYERPHLMVVKDAMKPDDTYMHVFTVPLSDTDVAERTRCASYIRYFLENTSIASNRGYYRNVRDFHSFHIKKLSMLYFACSGWGDNLKSETWEDDDPLKLHCLVSKESNSVWYGKMELYEEDHVLGQESKTMQENSLNK